MTLVVEDGVGRADAESLCSVAFASSYLTKRGTADALWADLDTDVQEAALRRATDFMRETYRLRWLGNRTTGVQSLDWPRYGVEKKDGPVLYFYPYNSVPTEIQQACAALALKATTQELAPDIGPPVIEETIGPITTKYAVGARQTTLYRQIDNLLSPFLMYSGSSFPISRA